MILHSHSLSVSSSCWRDEDLAQASRGITGAINLALVAFSTILVLAMMVS